MPLPDFVRVLDTYEAIGTAMRHLVGYAMLWFTEDTQQQAALIYKARMDQLAAEVQNRTLFFSLWFKSLDDAQADRLIAASGDRRYYLEATRHFKPYTLSEAEEKLINIKDVNGIDALVQLYDMITSKFEFTLEIDGEKKTMTRDELGSYVRHPSPEVRAAVYQELYRVYGDQRLVLAQIYNNRVRDWHNESIQLRGYREPISVRNLANDIPDAVTDTLLSVARQNNHLYQRYFKLKAKWLGLPKLRRYDVYAPLLQVGEALRIWRGGRSGAGQLSRLLADAGRSGPARVCGESHRFGTADRQAGRGVLLQPAAEDGAVGAAQLCGPRARCGDAGA